MDLVKAKTHHAALGWMLLCTLAFGVVAMHHVSAVPAAAHASATAEEGHGHRGHSAPSEECGHDQQHACKAVLSGSTTAQPVPQSVTLVDFPVDQPSAIEDCPGRPALSGRLLLTSVCVLRL